MPERYTFDNLYLLSRDPYNFREDCSCLFHSKLFCEQILTSCLISKSRKIIRCYLSPWVTALARRGKYIIVQLSSIGERKRHLVKNKNSLFRRLILISHKVEKSKQMLRPFELVVYYIWNRLHCTEYIETFIFLHDPKPNTHMLPNLLCSTQSIGILA